MKQLIFCIYISISLICGLSGCRTQAQAIQAVRNFEGNQSLDFDDIEFRLDSNPKYGFDGSDYALSKSNPICDWSVDALSGEVVIY